METYPELGITYNRDNDSVTCRVDILPCTTTEAHNSLPTQPISTHDIPLNPTRKTWLRLFKPINPPPNTALPLILYFHGGGFVMFSPSTLPNHEFCNSLAIALPAVVISIGYSLAPESRLPAAYEDAMDAIYWAKQHALGSKSESLFNDFVDFSNCYLMGTSAGGNIAYHAGLRSLSLDLHPLEIKGIILNHPFFSGLQRSQSELRFAKSSFSLPVSDVMWELSLPKGSNRDHVYCNPMVDGNHKEKIGLLARCFMNVRREDILMDRQMEFAKMLEVHGVDVVTWLDEGYHGMDIFEPEKAKDLFLAVKEFMQLGVRGPLRMRRDQFQMGKWENLPSPAARPDDLQGP